MRRARTAVMGLTAAAVVGLVYARWEAEHFTLRRVDLPRSTLTKRPCASFIYPIFIWCRDM